VQARRTVAQPNLGFTRELRYLEATLLAPIEEAIADAQALLLPVRKQINILCFGNSLTRGLYGNRQHYSYAIELQRQLRLLAQIDANVTVDGIDGRSVLKDYCLIAMKGRFCVEEETKYDLVIILSGTNDLANETLAHVQDVVTEIKALHTVALTHGASTVAVTIPDVRAAELVGMHKYKARHVALNTGIRTLVTELREDDHKCILFDLHALQPLHTATIVQQERWYEDDGLHFTPLGYKRFGRLLAQHLLEAQMLS
jgi:lysophospholipase L1-like esterase